MRVMVLATSSPAAETRQPEGGDFEPMVRYTEELIAAGVLLDSGRLQPSAKGARVRFDGSSRTVVDGPFTEAKELVAGYWIWQVRSLDEAIEWLKRAPFPGGVFEIRPVYDAAGSDDSPTPEVIERFIEQEERLRAAPPPPRP